MLRTMGGVYICALSMTTLKIHVRDIVELRPEEKMRRITASRIVAAMAYNLSFRNRTVGGFPRQPMG